MVIPEFVPERTREVGARLAQEEFLFHRSSDPIAPEKGVWVRLARPNKDEIDRVIEIQEHSPARKHLHLKPELISALVKNRQVLVAEVMVKDASGQMKKVPYGAIFFNSSDDPLTYAAVSDPSTHDLAHGQFLYDFWIIGHKDKSKSEDGTIIFRAALDASADLARKMGKRGPIAYSRASDAREHIVSKVNAAKRSLKEENPDKEDVQSSKTNEEFLEIVGDDSHRAYKALLLLRHILTTATAGRNAKEKEYAHLWDEMKEAGCFKDEKIRDVSADAWKKEREMAKTAFDDWTRNHLRDDPDLAKKILVAGILWKRQKEEQIANNSVEIFLDWVQNNYPRVLTAAAQD